MHDNTPNPALTAEQRAEIQKRVDAATAGPWIVAGHYYLLGDGEDNTQIARFERDDDWEEEQGANKALIAHARQDIPALLTTCTALEARAVEAEARAKRAEELLSRAVPLLAEARDDYCSEDAHTPRCIRHNSNRVDGESWDCTCGVFETKAAMDALIAEIGTPAAAEQGEKTTCNS